MTLDEDRSAAADTESTEFDRLVLGLSRPVGHLVAAMDAADSEPRRGNR